MRQQISQGFNRPVSIDMAIRISMLLIAIAAGFTFASAMAPRSSNAQLLADNASMKPVILSIDWQEDGKNTRGAIAVASR